MLQRLLLDGFFLPSSGAPNCRLFVLPKTDKKCSLIADLRPINSLHPGPLPGFRLPTPGTILQELVRVPFSPLFACTIDLTNFYWSLELPLDWVVVFRVPGGTYRSLPFGWNLAPVIAQTVLGEFLMHLFVAEGLLPFFGCSLWYWTYLDDVLVVSSDILLASSCATLLASGMTAAELVISPKSLLTPSSCVTWLGKVWNFANRSICPTTVSSGRAVALSLLAAVVPLSVKRMDTLLGTLNWCFSPRPGGNLFLSPWCSWRFSSSRF